MKYILLSISVLLLMKAGAQDNCADSSWHIRYSTLPGDSVRVKKIMLTRDNARIIAGHFIHGSTAGNAFITRVNKNGKVDWFRKLVAPFAGGSAQWDAIAEAANGNIFAATGSAQPDNKPFFCLVFSPQGNLLFQEKMGIPGNPASLGNAVVSTSLVSQFGPDSMLLTWVHPVSLNGAVGMTLVAVGNNGGAGQAATFIPPALTTQDAFYSNCRVQDNEITLYGATHVANSCMEGFFNQPAYAAVTVDWSTKQVIAQKIVCSPPAGFSQSGTPIIEPNDIGNTQIFFQSDGNVIVARRIWALEWNGTDTLTRMFKVSTFDNSFNHIRSEYICTPRKFRWWQEWDYNLFIDAGGKRHLSVLDAPGREILYAVSGEDGAFTLQKKMQHLQTGMATGNSYVAAGISPGDYTSFFISAYADQRTYIDNGKILVKDTAADCLGSNVNWVIVRPAAVALLAWSGNFAVRPVLVESTPSVFMMQDYPLEQTVICNIVHHCDTLRLNPPPPLCRISEPLTITVHKNDECDGTVRFRFDTTQVQSWLRVNDTTLRLTFHTNYQGKVYAEIDGCNWLTDSAEIIAGSPPQINLGPDTVFCPGKTYLFSAYNPTFQSYRWQDGSTADIYQAEEDGLYYVTAVDACNQVYTDTVSIIKKDFKIDIGEDREVCVNQDISLCVPAGYINYSWKSGGSSITGNTHCMRFTAAANTFYSIQAEVMTGCIIADTVAVTVITCPEYIWFPTSFTPNGDGLNDLFKPSIGAALESYELLIYNRWGQLIFKTTAPYEGWQGYSKDRRQDTGAFVWLCRYKFYNRPEKQIKGTVTLIR